MDDGFIQLAKYQCIDHEMTFEGVDLTGAVFVIRECFPAAISQAQFTLLDAPAGKARMYLPPAQSAEMKEGGKNFFRLEAVLPGGGNIVTPAIRINVT